MVLFGTHGDGIPPGTGTGTQTCECLQECEFHFSVKLESGVNIKRGGIGGDNRDPGNPPGAGRPLHQHKENRRTIEIKVRKKVSDWCTTKEEADQLIATQGSLADKLPECLKDADGKPASLRHTNGTVITRTFSGKIKRLQKKPFSSECCAPTFEGETLKCLTVCNGIIRSEDLKCVDNCVKVKTIERRDTQHPGAQVPYRTGYNWSICENQPPRNPNDAPVLTCKNTGMGSDDSLPPASQSDSDLMDSFGMDTPDGNQSSGGMDWSAHELILNPKKAAEKFGKKVRTALRNADCEANSTMGRMKKAVCDVIEELLSECVVSDKCCNCCE